MNFWQKQKKPLFVSAPMANVTDFAFRELLAKYGEPSVIWTEFVSADGLASVGRKRLLIDLKYSRKQKPIVAQLFTGHPDKMREACCIVAKMGFDGIDINMGCPDRAVEKQGGGASLLKSPDLAVSIFRSAEQGVRDAKKSIPISIKTRLGYNKIDLELIKKMLELEVPVITVHLRTRKEMSLVPAHWEVMPRIVELRDSISPETLIIGNGDVSSMAEARSLIAKYKCDGVMIGRGLFGTPWFFQKRAKDRSVKERLDILVEHAKLFDKNFRGKKNFAIMRKHFKAYVTGFDGAKELRVLLMETEDAKDVARVTKTWYKSNSQRTV